MGISGIKAVTGMSDLARSVINKGAGHADTMRLAKLHLGDAGNVASHRVAAQDEAWASHATNNMTAANDQLASLGHVTQSLAHVITGMGKGEAIPYGDGAIKFLLGAEAASVRPGSGPAFNKAVFNSVDGAKALLVGPGH
jgi:hypothetical protein